jgi:hypothetical protein
MSLMSIEIARNTNPFIDANMNALLMVSLYQITITFFVALVISTNSLSVFGLGDLETGFILCFINFAIIIFIAFLVVNRELKTKPLPDNMQWYIFPPPCF